MALEHVHSSYGMSGGFRPIAQPFPRIPPRQDARITPGFHPDNLALPAPGQAVAAENVVPDVSQANNNSKVGCNRRDIWLETQIRTRAPIFAEA